jgi:DNA polymerase-3 subunit gamma/tau
VLINGSQLAFDLLKTSSQRERMKDAIFAVTGKNYNLGPYKGPEVKEEKEDPLTALQKRAEEAGIPVTEK